MNDYRFGNYIYELRKKAGLSQSELAGMLGITNKAVSKWETGAAKPGTGMIGKLAGVFDVSADDLLRMREEKDSPNIFVIFLFS